jgi:hypothetical protein
MSAPFIALRQLMELHGWNFRTFPKADDRVELFAFDTSTKHTYSVTAQSEDEAMTELAQKAGWDLME